MAVHPFCWHTNHLKVLDQRVLPHKMTTLICRTPQAVASAIKGMAVRGAPAIGCCAAYGMVLAAMKNPKVENLRKAAAVLKAARPTAVNLAWAVERMLCVVRGPLTPAPLPLGRGGVLFSRLLSEARRIEQEDIAANKVMARHGAALFRKDSVILTHCNTGALATAGIGTAMGIIREVFSQGRLKKVFVDETRPYLQGARLTAWELAQEKIPHELITDSMAGHFMCEEKVSAVVVGCDRVAANGDTANKIGTYSLAVLAKYHHVPFYVAMPTSTLDVGLGTGADIPIEERSSDEVVNVGGMPMAPKRTKARHPAFDITPANLITAFVTEKGVVRPPYLKKLISFGRHSRESGNPGRQLFSEVLDSRLRHSGMTN